jgi:hypothetical protein
MRSDAFDQRQRAARRQLAGLPIEDKLLALVRLQETARDMARAAGREFRGCVWESRRGSGPPRRRAGSAAEESAAADAVP